MSQLIHYSIVEKGLPKKAVNILRKLDPIVEHYDQRNDKPDSIAVYSDDYRYLRERLEEANQDIEKTTYRGYRLRNYDHV